MPSQTARSRAAWPRPLLPLALAGILMGGCAKDGPTGLAGEDDPDDQPDVPGAPAANIPPTVTVNGVAGGEGAVVALSLVIADENGDPLTYSWNLGDGTTGTTAPPASHSYRDNGAFELSVTVSDGRASTTARGTATIANVAPTATLVAPTTVQPGESFTVELRDPVEPSPADSAAGFTYTFDCGEAAEGPRSGSASSRVCHPASGGSRTVRASIRDKDGGQTDYSVMVVVGGGNAAPTATLVTNGPLVEGGTFSVALTNPVDAPADAAAGFSYSFDCGAGFGAYGASASRSCTRADDGTVTVRGRIRDQHGAVSEYATQVRIANAAPEVTLSVGDEVVVGERLTGNATFTDPGTDSWRVRVEWGDGTPAEEGGVAVKSYALSHTYAKAGTFTVTVTVTDDDGGVGRRTAQVSILSAADAAESWLIPAIEAVCAEAQLTPGSCNSLISKVRTAIRHLDDGKAGRGVEELKGFRNEVASLERNAKLTAAQAVTLLVLADRLIEAIE